MGRAKRPPFYIVVWRVTIDFEIRKGERAGAQFGYTTRYGSLTKETLHKTFSREGNCPPELGRQLLLNRRLVEIAREEQHHASRCRSSRNFQKLKRNCPWKFRCTGGPANVAAPFPEI